MRRSTSDHYCASAIAALCARAGVDRVIISPGSRSAPLVLAFHHQPEIECLTIIDERSAGFFALGSAMVTGRPVALICTSGSALLNYGPAIAEAAYQNVPLLILSADRPEELIDQGEGQAIRQTGLFGDLLRGSYTMPRKPIDDLARSFVDRQLNEALMKLTAPPPGPVHINFPFQEPLYGICEAGVAPRWIAREPVDHSLARLGWDMTEDLAGYERIIVLLGQGHPGPREQKQLARLAEMSQVVVLGEATSNLGIEKAITCLDRVLAGMPGT
ncbi:MAG: 2-succinyl-5-enolpyruvyl-6-hydroxy-3-cyclohexene-1-carboxylic-acid synthase, partial [Flavobacteriales bacterium]|nr:2-succinyl-5-enolpyruvyl-6-hydroxy-3-cyclohexene-1-carboxylic-acid synthase [Flavobacteriales bacterium]